MSTHNKLRIFGVTFFVLFIGGGVLACGPNFPNRLLIGGDYVVLKAPSTNFYSEVKSIAPPSDPGCKVPDRGGVLYDEFLINTEAADLGDALENAGISEKRRQEVVAQYRNARRELRDNVNAFMRWKGSNKGVFGVSEKPLGEPEFDFPVFAKEVPAEFVHYFQGAVFYKKRHMEKSRQAWAKVLKLPKAQRRYRSVWSMYMIGRTMHDQPETAIKCYKLVRHLAEKGFSDNLGLAPESFGWQARIMLDTKMYDKAIELYLLQMATGDTSAIISLQTVAILCFAKSQPDVLEKMAENKYARQVLTAYVISRQFNKKLTLRWLAAVTNANVKEHGEADRLALAAYQTGEIELARKWLDLSGDATDIAVWLRAKLHLYDGNVDQAAKLLAGLAQNFPVANYALIDGYEKESISRRVRGELGTLYLARGQYVESLDVLLAGGYWEDAAYVAERVLTPQELMEYVDAKWPAVEGREDEKVLQPWSSGGSDWFKVRIRYLLARRLGRLEMYDKAYQYYPKKWQPRLDAYVQAILDGDDSSKPDSVRADALWKAACIARYQGMELFGSEVAPDWFYYGGNFDREAAHVLRGSDNYSKLIDSKQRFRSDRIKKAKIVPSSKDEQKKIEMHGVTPERRFHYRYKALDMAWEAAELMEDQSDKTARVLCIAGSWQASKQPKEADIFYKAMVKRCGNTELGKQADKLRWFPKIEVDKAKLLK